MKTSLALLSLGVLSVLPLAQAQSTWNGGSNNWGTPTNWAPVGVPAPGDNITISNAVTTALTLDVDRSIGSLTYGDTGTRITAFTINAGVGTTLTFNNGVTANGTFPATSTNSNLNLRGNSLISADQTVTVAGSANHPTDQGVWFREIGAGAPGTLVLNGNLTKEGVGQMLFTGTVVSGAGNVIVNEGNLKFNAGSSMLLNVGGPGNLTINNSAILAVYKNSGTMNITRPIVMNNSATLTTRAGVVDIASPITWNNTPILDAANGANAANFTGAWSGSGTITRTGGAVLNLNGTLTGFTGTLNASAGTTNINSAFGGSLGTSGTAIIGGENQIAGPISLNGGTINVNAATPASLNTPGNLTLAGTTNIALSVNPASTAPFTVLTYGGTLTGTAANLALPGSANYRSPVFNTGTGTNSAITLAFGSENRVWNGTASGLWDLNTGLNWNEGDLKFLQLDTVTFGDTGAGTIAITGNLSPSSFTVNSTLDYTFTAAAGNLISGAGSLTKDGPSIMTLGGVNTFSGGIFINGGTLKPSGSQALGANGQIITVAAGASLDTNGSMGANRDYHARISGTGVGGLGAITNSAANGNNNGFGSITLLADATVGGINRFDIRPITAGTALLDLAGFTLTKIGTNTVAIVDGSTTNGNIDINGGILALTRTVVDGTGTIAANAGGILQFENNTTLPSVTRPLAINDATLRNQGANFTVASPITVTGSSTFETVSNTFTLSNTVSGAGSINKTGGTTLILTGDASHLGGTTIATGTLQIGNGGATGSITGDITNNATLAFNRTGTLTYAGAISGSGALTKLGNSTLTLSGAHSAGGATTVSAGTLIVNNTHGVAFAPFTVAAAATLGGIGPILNDVVVNGTLSPGNSAGALVGTGWLTFGPDSSYRWEVDNWAGTVPGTAWDHLNVDKIIFSNTLAQKLTIKIAGTVASFSETNKTFEIAKSALLIDTFDAANIAIDATSFPGTGTWAVQTAASGGGTVVQLVYTAGTTTPFQNWIAGFPAITDPNDKLVTSDFDKDGLQNMVEYVLNSDPSKSTSQNLPTANKVGNNLVFVFTRLKAARLAGFTSDVQYSQTLLGGSWTLATVGMTNVVDNGTTETVTVTIPIPGGATKLFAQLLVTAP